MRRIWSCGGLLFWLSVMGLAPLPTTPVDGQSRSPRVLIGAPVMRDGLRVTAGYVPWPVPLEPPGQVVEGELAVHLQIEVDAVAANPYGLDTDDPVSYLRIPFTLVHTPTGRRQDGTLAPMVSRDGFHYGANVSLPGSGTYTLSIEVRPPEGLSRHADPRTGVQQWWNAFILTWSFEFVIK